VKSTKATSGTVLVIEDEADVLDLVRYHLEKAGFRVIVAYAARMFVAS
jgi:DNA-binding response OmpR family regulator